MFSAVSISDDDDFKRAKCPYILGYRFPRHLPVQRGIGGLIDLPHTPLPDEGGDVKVVESDAPKNETRANGAEKRRSNPEKLACVPFRRNRDVWTGNGAAHGRFIRRPRGGEFLPVDDSVAREANGEPDRLLGRPGASPESG